MSVQQAQSDPQLQPTTIRSFTASNLASTFFIILLVAVASFWLRSLWESNHYYESDCIARPSAECIENLRRAASWNSPGNDAARDALEDLKTLSIGSSQFKPLAGEALDRSLATSRSILDSNSLKLKSDLNPAYAVAAFVSFVGWIWCSFLIIWKGFRADGGRDYSRIRKYGILAGLFILMWLAALARA